MEREMTENKEYRIKGHLRRPKVLKLSHAMPIINCVCGTQILVVPDCKTMSKAIKSHLNEHKKTKKHHIEQDLIAQIFKLTSNLNV